MGIFDLFKKKNSRDNLTEEDREYGIKIRDENREFKKKKMELAIITEELRAKKEQAKLDLEIQKLEQELADMQEDDEDLIELPEGANPEDTMLVALLSKVLNNNQQPTPVVNSTPIQATNQSNNTHIATGVSITDDKINAYIGTIPKNNLKLAKKLNDEQLRAQIIGVVPEADADSVQRIMQKIRA